MTASTRTHEIGKHPAAKEERKLRKPLIEKKRRERINKCLDELKQAVIGAFRLDQSKLEKADILEMTVKHLQNIQSSNINDSTSCLEAHQKYSTGYIQCMHEVHNLLLSCKWMDQTLGTRLLNHLLASLPDSSDRLPSAPPTTTPGNDDPMAPLRHGGLGSPQRGEREETSMGVLKMWRPW